jgi:hypothetical protein
MRIPARDDRSIDLMRFQREFWSAAHERNAMIGRRGHAMVRPSVWSGKRERPTGDAPGISSEVKIR